MFIRKSDIVLSVGQYSALDGLLWAINPLIDIKHYLRLFKLIWRYLMVEDKQGVSQQLAVQFSRMGFLPSEDSLPARRGRYRLPNMALVPITIMFNERTPRDKLSKGLVIKITREDIERLAVKIIPNGDPDYTIHQLGMLSRVLETTMKQRRSDDKDTKRAKKPRIPK